VVEKKWVFDEPTDRDKADRYIDGQSSAF
jgi:hypothetical protein